MFTVTFVLVCAAFVLTLLAAAGKGPLWSAVFVLIVVELLQLLPR